MLLAIPLLFIPVVIYAIIIGFGVLGSGGVAAAELALGDPLFSISMVSGTAWNVGTGDLILFLSLILFVFCLVAFLLFKGFATSTFFLILTMVMLDVLAGFIVTIISARKDLDFASGT
ncbi:MAG: hypothetical protein RLZZ542_579 [Pseudomonadota bacterium]